RARASEAAARAERLREAEQRTRAIIDTANDGFVAMDETGRIVGFSPRAQEMSGFTPEEVMGRPLVDTIVPARLREAFQREIEFTGIRQDGSEFPVEVTVAPLRDHDRWVFNAFVRDISERKRSELQIREHAEDLARIAEVARDLSGVTDAHAARPAICKAAKD